MKRILWLSNREDVSEEVPIERRARYMAARQLDVHLGEHIEVTTHVIWPDPKLPALIEGSVARYEPPPDLYSAADRLHTDEAGHRWIAGRQAAALIAAFEAAKRP